MKPKNKAEKKLTRENLRNQSTARMIQEELSETRLFLNKLLHDLENEGFRTYTSLLMKSRQQTRWVRSDLPE